MGERRSTIGGVVELRSRADWGESYESLGKAFGISAVQAARIHKDLNWHGEDQIEYEPIRKRPGNAESE